MFGRKKPDPPPQTGLQQKTFTELVALRAEIDALLEPMREQAMERLRQDMAALEIGPEDLKPARKKRDVAIKYRDPDNPENTWTGMGKPKKWVQAYLDQGRELTEFAVQ